MLTVVFVDVVDSTGLLTSLGDARATAAIDRVLHTVRERLEPYGGREVKALGDGLMLTFESPRSAVAFSVAVQQRIGATRPQLRIGMNFGETTGGDDPVGEAVNAAARIADRAKAGEVVVSDIVRQLAGSVPGTPFVDHGRARLKGFSGQWQLYRAVAGASSEASLPAFGRTGELDLVDQFVSAVGEGSGRILLLDGEAGIGKSHLARALIERATACGIRTVTAGADELEQDRPGRILDRIADVVGSANKVGAPDRDGVPEDAGYAIVERFTAMVDTLSAVQPVIIVVEDLHWGDPLSLRGLAALARRIGPLAVGIVATLRPTPRPPHVGQFLEVCAKAGAVQISLAGLEPAGMAQLAAASIGAAPGPELLARLEATAGNPLFVVELVRALDDADALRIEGGVAEIIAGDILPDLARTLARSISALPEATVQTLRLASLFGNRFALVDLATVAGRSVVEVAAALREAVDASFIVGRGDELAFRHDLLREAVYFDLPAAIRRDLHAAAARALAAAGAPAEQVARQYRLGARPGDVDAVEWLTRAATESLAVDTSNAAMLTERALALAPLDWPLRFQQEAMLVDLLAWSGRVDDGRHLADALLARALTADDRWLAHRALGCVLGTLGELTGAATQFEAAAAISDVGPIDSAVLQCAAAGMRVIAGTATDAEAVAQQFVESDDPAVRCWARHTIGIAAICDGRYDEALDAFSISRHLLDAHYVPPLGFLIPHVWVATAHYELDDLHQAEVAAMEARRRAERRGDAPLLIQALTATSGFGYITGRWQEAMVDVEAGMALGDEIGENVQAIWFEALAADIALGRGDRAAAEAYTTNGEALLASGTRHLFGVEHLLWTKAKMLEADGAGEAACELMLALWAQLAPLRGLIHWRGIGPDLVRLCRQHDRIDTAHAIADEHDELARRSTSACARATAHRARGLVEHDADMLIEAARQLRDTPRLVEFAATCEDAAATLVDHGRNKEAIELAAEAGRIYEAIGARGHLARTDAALTALGVKRLRRATPASSGWESLTAKELEVVELIADGLSNPEIADRLFISRRTVETHLAHIFRKLTIGNRTHLATTAIGRRRPSTHRPGADAG